jgi:hypothetical protein
MESLAVQFQTFQTFQTFKPFKPPPPFGAAQGMLSSPRRMYERPYLSSRAEREILHFLLHAKKRFLALLEMTIGAQSQRRMKEEG